jgi:hypothetical protein
MGSGSSAVCRWASRLPPRPSTGSQKYLEYSTLSGVDLSAELGARQAVQRLKQEPGDGVRVGGMTLPVALADLGLIDEYEFVVQPVFAGHVLTMLAGLNERIQLDVVNRQESRSGAVVAPENAIGARDSTDDRQ